MILRKIFIDEIISKVNNAISATLTVNFLNLANCSRIIDTSTTIIFFRGHGEVAIIKENDTGLNPAQTIIEVLCDCPINWEELLEAYELQIEHTQGPEEIPENKLTANST